LRARRIESAKARAKTMFGHLEHVGVTLVKHTCNQFQHEIAVRFILGQRYFQLSVESIKELLWLTFTIRPVIT